MVWSRLLTNLSAVDANLPYNWNWQRNWGVAATFLERYPICLIDIGARGDPPPELEGLRPYVRRVGFEPDIDECDRLNGGADGRYFPILVAGGRGRQVLQLYRDRGYSSTLRLSGRYQRLWSGEIPIDGTHELDTTTIDAFIAEHPTLAPDLLKIDTQGSELAILEGAEASLSTIGLVEVEVEFLPMYQDQPLAGAILQFMAEHGFELLYLNRAFVARRQIYEGPSRGQVVFGDALFGKREDRLDGFTDQQRAKYAILLIHYGHLDIAWQLMEDWPELGRLVPGLGSVFRGPRSARMRGALMQFDKLLALALHLRGYNQRATDSDRSWPFR